MNPPRDARASGQLGERLAEWFLTRRGYRIREKNARVGRFEIDLVMDWGRWIVFVEVKARGQGSWAGAASVLASSQRRRLAAAAQGYADRVGGDRPVRFDVLTIDETPDRLVIEHWPDALGAGGKLR
jgi:putative endonuclease